MRQVKAHCHGIFQLLHIRKVHFGKIDAADPEMKRLREKLVALAGKRVFPLVFKKSVDTGEYSYAGDWHSIHHMNERNDDTSELDALFEGNVPLPPALESTAENEPADSDDDGSAAAAAARRAAQGGDDSDDDDEDEEEDDEGTDEDEDEEDEDEGTGAGPGSGQQAAAPAPAPAAPAAPALVAKPPPRPSPAVTSASTPASTAAPSAIASATTAVTTAATATAATTAGGGVWREARNKAGEPYYYHSVTREVSWVLPTGTGTGAGGGRDPWIPQKDAATGRTYYYNRCVHPQAGCRRHTAAPAPAVGCRSVTRTRHAYALATSLRSHTRTVLPIPCAEKRGPVCGRCLIMHKSYIPRTHRCSVTAPCGSTRAARLRNPQHFIVCRAPSPPVASNSRRRRPNTHILV